MDDILLAYAGLISLATITIYAGAWGSLPLISSKSPPKAPNKGEEKDKVEEDESLDLDERISSSGAYLLPLMASVGLLGFHMALKYLSKEWINWLLSYYFALIGIGSVWRVSVSSFKLLLGRDAWSSFDRTQILLVKNQSELLRLSFRTPTPFMLPFAAIPSTIYILSDPTNKQALITNILSLSFAFNALCFLKLDSFKAGTILLSGLFLYDVWWVFGTNVMVQVAQTLDVPIKVLWPKSPNGNMLLGLGDIVVPGLFITLALRRDLFASPSQDPCKVFEKPYFRASIFAYVFGLSVTIYALHVSGTAQPALLYLSPACIICFFLTAVFRGELRDVWNWEDGSQQVMENRADAKPAQVQREAVSNMVAQ